MENFKVCLFLHLAPLVGGCCLDSLRIQYAPNKWDVSSLIALFFG